jgi:hypothetical protein
VAVLGVGLLVAGAILVGFARRLYFYGDDWDFLLTRGTVEGADLGLFTPHNEHWSTVPILVYRALFAVFGLDQYLPFALAVILVHLALCALLYVALVRLGSGRGAAVVASLALAFFGGGAQNTLWDFQLGFVAPLALAMAAVWAWSRWPGGVRGVTAAGVLLVVALMCSGVGIAAVVLVVGFVTLTSGWRSAVAVGTGPTLVFLVWYLTIGNVGSSIPTDRSAYLQVPDYVWTGLTSAIETAAGVEGSGPVLLLVLLVVPFVVRDVSPGVRALAVAGIVTAFAQFTLQGWSRVGLGVEQATAGRYAYLVLALLAPALSVVCAWLGRRAQEPRWAAALLVAALGVGYVLQGVQEQRAFVDERREVSPDLERLIRGVQAVTASGGPVLVERPFPAHHPNVATSLLASPEARAAISKRPVTAQTELDATGLVRVGVAPTSFGLPAAADVRLDPGIEAVPATGDEDPGCRSYVAPASGAGLSLDSPPGGAQVAVTSDAVWMTTSLRLDGLRSAPNHRPVVPGEPVYVAVDVPGATLRVSFGKGGRFELCSAG